MAPLVEIRVITYRRPQWLKEALASLQAQTLKDWTGVVYDDSPDREGQEVVAHCADPRITYSPNPKNLGASLNTSQAFRTQARQGGKYACLLEDDNWLFPDFLEANVQALETSKLSLLARNQEVWTRTEGGKARSDITTLGHWYLPGVMTPLQLHALTFFFPGVSHGSLFWRTDLGSILETSAEITDCSLQEFCRCAQIWDLLLYEPEPKAAYAEVLSGVKRPIDRSKSFGRFLQFLRRSLYKIHGRALIDEAERIASRLQLRAELERNLLNAWIFPSRLEALPWTAAAQRVLWGGAKFCLIRHPSPGYTIPRPGFVA
jgi:glycosyltransferase involved in cell wall biosynthesis